MYPWFRSSLTVCLAGALLAWVVMVAQLADQPLEQESPGAESIPAAPEALTSSDGLPSRETTRVQHAFTFTSNEECCE